MKNSRLSYTLVFALTTAVMAGCGGEQMEAESPPPTAPPPAPTTPAQTDAAKQTDPVATAPEAIKKEEPPPPAPKPLKERLAGTWQLDFSGEYRTAAEEDAKKKAGKDEKKLADLMKKSEETAAKDKWEASGDSFAVWTGDKTTSKAKYEIVKEDPATNTIVIKRVGKDEISKKDVAAGEISITFKDENTIEVRDWREKDQKKAKLLVFKKGAAAATPATPAGGAGDASGAKGGATPATPATPPSNSTGGDKSATKGGASPPAPTPPATPGAKGPASPATPATPATPSKK